MESGLRWTPQAWAPTTQDLFHQCSEATKPPGTTGFRTASWWSQGRVWVFPHGLFLTIMPLAWEVTRLIISAAPFEDRKCMALGLACFCIQADQAGHVPVCWGSRAPPSLTVPPFSPRAVFSLLPSHLVLLMVMTCPSCWGP